jgi:FkbM family methyltransferase
MRDFLRVMRVRLSQSKLGRFVAPRPIVVDVDLRTLGPSVRLRSHTSDISVLKELLMGGAYDPLPADAAVRNVVDLGANIGLSYRWLQSRYPDADFVCVEPDPGNLSLLRANADGPRGRAKVVAACVGGHERKVKLVDGAGEWGFRMTATEDPRAYSGEIDVVTMEGLLAEAGIERIGVLKCDIEGAEAEVFENCRSWIGRVDAMSVECHNDSMSSDALLATLASNGAHFTLRHIDRNPQLGFGIVTLVRDGAAAQ